MDKIKAAKLAFELYKKHKIVEVAKEMTDVQCSDGNWNYDAYMHGMANGMIYILSIIGGGEANYLQAPSKWLCDLPDHPVETCGASK